MILSELIKTSTKSFFSGTEENIMYFSVPEILVDYIYKFFPEKGTVINLEDDFSPIKPFLGILSKFKPTERDIAENAYTLHKSTFNSYFKTGKADRRMDLVVTEEIFYEKLRLKDTIVRLFKKYVSGVFCILNAQLLPENSIEILKELAKQKLGCKLIFIFNYISTEGNSSINEFYQKISNEKNFFEIRNFDKSLKIPEKIKIRKKPGYDKIISFLKNCRYFLSYEQAVTFLKRFEKEIVYFNFSKTQLRHIQLEAGLLFFRAGHFDSAISCLNSIIENQKNDDIEISALYCLCLLNHERSSNSTALKYAKFIKKLLIKNQDNPFFALASMMDYIITQKSDREESVSRYEFTLSLLEQQCLVNNYLYTLMIVPWQTLNDYETPYNMMPKIEKAISTADFLGNEAALSTAYYWKGILLLHSGKSKDSEIWYQKCNELRAKIGDFYTIMKIKNGLAYKNIIAGKFKESYNLINSFIGRITELKDNAEIILTVSNLATALFYSRNFYEAYIFFQKILHFFYMFDLEDQTVNSFLPEYNDILTFKTLLEFSLGYTTRAKINYQNIMNNGKPVTTINSPVLYLIKAEMQVSEKKFNEALETIAECEGLFSKFSSAQDFMRVFVYYEFANALKKEDNSTAAKVFFEKGFNLAKKSDLTYFTREKDSLTIDEYFNGIEKFPPVNINLYDIDEKAEKERLMTEMQKRLRDSLFLNKIMMLGSDSSSVKNYSSKIAMELLDYVSANAIFIAEKTHEGWKTLAHTEKNADSENIQKKIKNLRKLKTLPQNGNSLIFIPEEAVFYANISKYDFYGAIVIIPNKGNKFSEQKTNVLNIAISNIQAQLIMRNQNENLRIISSTDQLSKLKNRRALHEKLSLESEMIRRYQKKGEKCFQMTISFIDLDNFKNINDSFGHEAGDLVILKFANLLRKVYRSIDFISRFGGDEFVILLPNTNCEEAKNAAERLKSALKKADFFIQDIESLLSKNIKINPDQKLGFSMGIATNFNQKDISDIKETLSNADRALYKAKDSGKNTIIVWGKM